jgi:hypothetical protein
MEDFDAKLKAIHADAALTATQRVGVQEKFLLDVVGPLMEKAKQVFAERGAAAQLDVRSDEQKLSIRDGHSHGSISFAVADLAELQDYRSRMRMGSSNDGRDPLIRYRIEATQSRGGWIVAGYYGQENTERLLQDFARLVYGLPPLSSGPASPNEILLIPPRDTSWDSDDDPDD